MAETNVSFFTVHERIRGNYSFNILDRNGFPVPGSVLTSARMSLYHSNTPATPGSPFINGRQSQNILNANNVTIDEAGKVLWDIQSADTAITDITLFVQPRVAVFEFTWPQGLILHEVVFNIKNIKMTV